MRILLSINNVNDFSDYPEPGLYVVHDPNGITSIVDTYLNSEGKICVYWTSPSISLNSITIDEESINKRIRDAEDKVRNDMDNEIRKLQLEYDNPKRGQCGEWISGKTLKDIISILTGRTNG